MQNGKECLIDTNPVCSEHDSYGGLQNRPLRAYHDCIAWSEAPKESYRRLGTHNYCRLPLPTERSLPFCFISGKVFEEYPCFEPCSAIIEAEWKRLPGQTVGVSVLVSNRSAPSRSYFFMCFQSPLNCV